MKSVHAYIIGDAKMQNAEKMKITDVTKNFSKEALRKILRVILKKATTLRGKPWILKGRYGLLYR